MQEQPANSGIELANWNWKVVCQYISGHFGIRLSRSACLNWLHQLGFAFKRPKKRLLKADAEKREAFVAEYAALMEEACQSNAKTFFADEAHFRADAELRRQVGAERRASLGGLDQSEVRREGQLLLGSVPGDRRGGMDGLRGEQQQRNVGRVLGAVT